MDYFLYAIVVILFIVVLLLLLSKHKTKKQIAEAVAIVKEISAGNLDRRIIIDEASPVAQLCYQMNDIVIKTKSELTKHKQSERTYRKLITSLSHDIRTPLASLTGYLEAIQLGLVSDKEIGRYIDTSLRKAFDLQNYINTLFEWLKLESGERVYHHEDTDVFELIREITAEWIPQFENAHMEYDISISEANLTTKIDKTALKRIIDNLLQNSLIHSRAAKIKLAAQQNKNRICIKISDDGVGIPETHLPHIFDRLYKCNAARGVSGNGLGLSIVQELVKGLKGEISVQSKEGQSTEFNLSIPILR